MISLDAAQEQLLALAVPVACEHVTLDVADGRWIAEDLIAKRTQPARNLSAMDGYAVALDGTDKWRVIGESLAGKQFPGTLGHGEAVRIFTGAVVPVGCDSVCMQENTVRDGDSIRLASGIAPTAGAHIRKAGSDFSSGDVLLTAGARLDPRSIALAAMAGYGTLAVRRAVKVAILSTGDELVPPGAPNDDDHIPASNGVMIAAMMRRMGATIHDLGLIPDQLDATIAAINAASGADVIVTIGGASVGDHDLVRPALIATGADIAFWKIAMRPGKPVMAGTLRGSIVLGLPGNPVSAFVTALLLLGPLVAKLSGDPNPRPIQTQAILGAPLPAVGARTDHIRARMIDGRVRPIGQNDSAMLGALAAATCLIVRPVGSPSANIADTVNIITIA